jgi:hypothetical protein
MDFTHPKVNRIITHKVGNKLKNEPLFLSDSLQPCDAELEEVLVDFFLRPFLRKEEYMSFTHASDINLNEAYHYVRTIFETAEEGRFIATSRNIAKHLFNASTHPKIVPGELLIVHFANVPHGDANVSAVGIFKSEHKESFLKVTDNGRDIRFSKETGINISRIEKGCLVFDDADGEYDVLVIDRDQHTQYWVNKFLNVEPKKTDAYNTKQVLSLCKAFGDEVLSLKYEPDAKLDFLNGAVDFLEKNERFDYDAFIRDETIFRDPGVRKEFLDFREFSDFEPTPFEIAQRDVKRERRMIKSVVRLDTGMEVRFSPHASGEKYFEKGFDAKRGMHYYTLFFNEELE